MIKYIGDGERVKLKESLKISIPPPPPPPIFGQSKENSVFSDFNLILHYNFRIVALLFVDSFWLRYKKYSCISFNEVATFFAEFLTKV